MTKWDYATMPLLTHATKAILAQWGADGWELVQVIRQTLDTNLALVAAQANLTLRCTLHEERVRLSRRAQCARDPTLVVAVG